MNMRQKVSLPYPQIEICTDSIALPVSSLVVLICDFDTDINRWGMQTLFFNVCDSALLTGAS